MFAMHRQPVKPCLTFMSQAQANGACQENSAMRLTMYLCTCRNPLRRSHSFALKDGLKLTFMSRGSQPNLVAYADDEADQASSGKDEIRKKAGHMRTVSLKQKC